MIMPTIAIMYIQRDMQDMHGIHWGVARGNGRTVLRSAPCFWREFWGARWLWLEEIGLMSSSAHSLSLVWTSTNWWGWGHQWGPLEARPSGHHCWKVPCCQPHWQPVYTVSEAWRKRASQNSKQSTIVAKRHAYRHALTNFYDTDTDTQLDTPTDTFTAITTHTNNRIHTPQLGPTPTHPFLFLSSQ